MGRLVRKDDPRIGIVGTADYVPATALVLGATRLPDGSLDIRYEGNTEVFWDLQFTRNHEGEPLWVDENGRLVRESNVLVVEDAEEGE